MDSSIVAISILVLAFGFNLIELKIKHGKLRSIRVEWVSNLCLGMIERLLALFFFYPFLDLINPLFGEPVFSLGSSFLVFILGLFLVDLAWYGFHFIAHKWKYLWLVHKAHHAPVSMDFSVAFVNHPVGTFLRGFIYCGIAKIGVPVEFVLTAVYIKAFYQYFQHTEMWNSIPILDKVFVMPVHHRIHHSNSEEHIDKNFGGVFIFWDKIFGTYNEEKSPVEYGLKNENMPLSVIASLLGGFQPKFVPKAFSYFPKSDLSLIRVFYLFGSFLLGFCFVLFVPDLKGVAVIVTISSVVFLAMGSVVARKSSMKY